MIYPNIFKIFENRKKEVLISEKIKKPFDKETKTT